MMKRTRILLALLLLVSLFLIAISIQKGLFINENSINKNSYSFLNTKIGRMMKLYGIEKTADIIDGSFKQNSITIDECHDLLHILGHTAYEFYPNNWPLLTSPKSSFCLDSYQHGVEAQIVLEDFTDPEKMYAILHKYCLILNNNSPGITCYHGVGHAAVQETKNINVALKICDTVASPSEKPNDCYRGAFSEYVNELKGIDGDTNAPIPGVSPTPIAKGQEFRFCSTLEQKYKPDCISQFVSYIYNGNLEETLSECSSYSPEISAICARVSTADFTLTNLPKSQSVQIPKNITTMNSNLQKGYVDGVLEGLTPYVSQYGSKIENNFCNSLNFDNEKEYCLKSR